MSAEHTPWPAAWFDIVSPAQLIETAIYMQEDARYLYQCADMYRDAGNNFMAIRVQVNAAYSAALARAAIARYTEGQS